MASPVECCSPCVTPVPTQVPGMEGPAGTAGTNGTNGGNSYSNTTADFVVPAADGATTVTVSVLSSDWMVAGQPIFIGGLGGTFKVSSVPDSQHVVVVYQNYPSNVNAGSTVVSGSEVTPSGFQPAAPTLPAVDPISSYASGTAYSLTTTPAQIVFGTVSPQITITAVGTWMIHGRIRIDYNAATFAAVRNVTLKARRTNNTPGDLANCTAGFKTQIITTLTYTAQIVELPPVAYVTALTTDIIQLWGSIDTGPTAGSIDAVQAEIVAVFVHA